MAPAAPSSLSSSPASSPRPKPSAASTSLEAKFSLIFNRDSISDAPMPNGGSSALPHLITSRRLQAEPSANDEALPTADSHLLKDLEESELAAPYENEEVSVGTPDIRYDVFLSFNPVDHELANKIRASLASLDLEVATVDATEDTKPYDPFLISECAIFCPLVTPSYEDDPISKKEMLYADEIRRPFVPVITSRLQRSWSEILTAGHIGLQLAETFDRDADEWKAVMEDLLKSILVAAGASELPSPSKARLSTKFTDGTSILLPSEILNRLSTTSNPSHFSPPGTPTRSRRGSAFLRLSSPIPARPNSLQNQQKPVVPKGLELLRVWLKPLGHAKEMEHLAEKCHRATRVWLHDQLSSWVEKDHRIAHKALWLVGPSGNGKSVAMARWCTTPPRNVRLSWFQIRPDHSDRLLPSTIINTLAYRLALEMESMKETLLSVCGNAVDVADRETSTPQRIRKLLVDPLVAAAEAGELRKDTLVIIIDGIDAMPVEPRKDLINAIVGEWDKFPLEVRFIFTSAMDQGIQEQLAPLKPAEVELFGMMQRKDLFAYAGSLIRSILPAITEDDYHEASAILTGKSLGQFLWLHLAFEPLRTAGGIATSPAQLLASLETFPVGLDKVYHGLLESRLGAGDYTEVEMFRRVVGAMLVIKEPISIPVLSKLLDMSLVDTRRTLYKIASFVEFCDESDFTSVNASANMNGIGFTPAPLPSPRLRLSHTDFKDFLTSDRCVDERFRINIAKAEADLSLRCMVLLMTGLRPNPLDLEDPVAWLNAEIPDLEGRFQGKVSDELRYAIKHWCFHLLALGQMISDSPTAADVVAAPNGMVTATPGTPALQSAAASAAMAAAVDPKILKAVEELTCLVCSEKLLEWLEHLSLMSSIGSTAFISLRALALYLHSIKPATALSSVMTFFQRNLANAATAAASLANKAKPSSLNSSPSLTAASLSDDSGPVPASITKLLQQSIASPNPPLDLAQTKHLVRDAQRFLQDFYYPLTASSYHIYISALPFSPPASHLYRTYSPRLHRFASSSPSFRRVPRVVRGTPEQWHPCLWTLRAHTRTVSTVCVSMDGRWIVSGGHDRAVRVFDAETGMLARTLEGHGDQVWNVTCSADGRWIVSGGADGMVKTWDAATGRCVRSAKGKTWGVNGLAMTPDGGRIVILGGGADSVLVQDAKNGETVWTLKGHTGAVCGVAVGPDGRWIVSCGEDRTVRIWDMNSGKAVRILDGHANVVNAVCVSPDGRWVVSGSKDTTVRVWEMETGRCVQILEGHTNSVNCVAVSPDGRRIVSGSDDRTVRVWECDPARNSGGLMLPTSVQMLLPTALSSKAAGTPANVTSPLSPLSLRAAAAEDDGHGDTVRALAVSVDGRFVTSAGADSTVRVWNAETGRLVRVIETRSLNVGSWEEAARRVAKAEMLGLTDGGASGGMPDDDEEEPFHDSSTRRQGSPLLFRRPTVVSVNGVAVAKKLSVSNLTGDAIKTPETETEEKHGSPVPGDVIRPGAFSTVWVLQEDGWMMDRKENGTRRLWVPATLRGNLTSFQGRIVAIGTPAGFVVIIHV